MTKIQKRVASGVAGLLVIAVGAASLGAASSSNQPEQEATTLASTAINVRTAQPDIGDIVIQSEYMGTVDPNQKVTVYPKASGEVLTVYKNVGDEVKAGDVLAEIDSKTLRTTIAQTEATLASAQAKVNYSLAMAEKDLETHEFNIDEKYDTSIIQAEAGVKTAENKLELAYSSLRTARSNLDKLRTTEESYFVAGTGSYSQDIEQLEQLVQQAEINVEAAQLGVEQAKETLRSTKMLNKEKAVSANDAVELARLNTDLSDQYIALDKLKDDLSNYVITASISGIIEQRAVDPYDIVAQSQSPVFVISNKDAMTISFNVAEAALSHMQVGDKVTVEKNDILCDGVVTEINTMVDTRSGLFTVKASVADAPANFYSGSAVKVYSDAQKAEQDMMIPIDAVYYEKGEPFVYLAIDGKAVKTYIETGISDESNIQVISGLDGSEQIITSWNAGLADGVDITLVGGGEESSSDTEEE